MRLKSIYISQYKNLRNFILNFDGASFIDVFVGKNGTGKSNLFEALIEIFRHVVEYDREKELTECETEADKDTAEYNGDDKKRLAAVFKIVFDKCRKSEGTGKPWIDCYHKEFESAVREAVNDK